MPFVSRSQMRAAFAGALGPEMKSKAREWAHETPDIKHLPQHKGRSHAVEGLKRAMKRKRG